MADEQTRFYEWIEQNPGSTPTEIAIGARLTGRSLDTLLSAGEAEHRLWQHQPATGNGPRIWAAWQVDRALDGQRLLDQRGWGPLDLLKLEDKTLRGEEG